MTKASILVKRRNSFSNIFITSENIGLCGCTYAINEYLPNTGFNFLLTEIIYLNSSFDKYKDKVIDYHFFNECQMRQPIMFSDNKPEITQMNEIISRCFSPDIADKFTFQLSCRAYSLYIHTFTKGYNALYRCNENPMNPKQSKNILFEAQQGIGCYQKDYGLEIDINTIFNELIDYITANEK